eukprot:1691102-Alexandrium_andersonii.AAC.1
MCRHRDAKAAVASPTHVTFRLLPTEACPSSEDSDPADPASRCRRSPDQQKPSSSGAHAARPFSHCRLTNCRWRSISSALTAL